MTTEQNSNPSGHVSAGAFEDAVGSPANSTKNDTARSTEWKWASVGLLVAALACLFGMLNFVAADSVRVLDFVGFYTTGEIVRQGQGRHLYDLNLQQKVESEFLSQGKFFPLDHPPFESWLCLPLAFLTYRQAYLFWAGFNLLVLALIFYLLPGTGYRLDAESRLIWLATCLPLAAGVLVLGQDSLLLVPVFILTFLALKRRRDSVAGLVLGAGLFRFEILLPFVFVFFLRRRWNVLAGFSVGVITAILASLPLVGWSGLVAYGKVLLEVGRVTGSGGNGVNVANMPSLRGALAAFSNGALPPAFIFPSVLVGTLLLLVWAAREFRSIAEPERPEFDLQFSFAVIAALLASYHMFSHELTPLILVAYLALGYEHVARKNQKLRDRPGAALLLLFSLTMMVGGVLGFRNFSVLFVVLAGMLVWLWQEMAEPETAKLP